MTLAQATVTIYDPDGGRLGATAYVTKSGLFVDARTLPESGAYSIVVDPYSDAVGSMTLELYDVPADSTPRSRPADRRSASSRRFRGRTRAPRSARRRAPV